MWYFISKSIDRLKDWLFFVCLFHKSRWAKLSLYSSNKKEIFAKTSLPFISILINVILLPLRMLHNYVNM